MENEDQELNKEVADNYKYRFRRKTPIIHPDYHNLFKTFDTAGIPRISY